MAKPRLRNAVNNHSAHIRQVQQCRAPYFISRLSTKYFVFEIASAGGFGINEYFKAATEGLTSGG
jgi:hypothetical protein